ncbi:MAG: LuxR C-terminal-related transcriptional regulator, partial [Muribaculaceae bacterium]|nr:LuxR C-terminal-related transcriptional regulator [Muribaculaceae bacterium]
LEHDIKHKSEELSNITMNVVRKNELLLDIASMVTKIQEHPDLKERRSPEVTRQFNKIQSVIHNNISHDDDWKDFTSNFDQAYDNYTQKLRNLHPDLSEGDLRMCCYLRMGLSSKEIAPLLNISYRSVEMSRYRLRKKMNLTREINLTDYLQRL